MNQASLLRRGRAFSAFGVAALLAVFAAPVAFAGNTGTSADMPTFVPGATLVGQGNIQVEAGLANTRDGSGTALMRTWSTPALLRFGMPNYEIRLQSDAYSRVRTYSAVNNGIGDMTLGIKANVPQTLDPDIALAVVLQAAMPSGSAKVKSNGVRPEAQFIGQWNLPNSNSLGGVIGLRSDVDTNNERYKSGLVGANFGHTWNPQVTTYAEMAIKPWQNARRGGKNLMYDLGAAWRPMPATQLNATVGFGVKENDTDMAWTVGVSRGFRPPSMTSFSHKQDDKKPVETPSATTEDGK